MKILAPQESRTFFVTSVTWGRRSLFQVDCNALLLIDVLRNNRSKGRFQLHEFVIMLNHFHLLLTPAHEHSLEKCMQFIKGGFSFRAKRELGLTMEIWELSFTEHRTKDEKDYAAHVRYIHENPVRGELVQGMEDYPYSSANMRDFLDAAPMHLRG